MPIIFQKIIKRDDLLRNHDPEHSTSNVLYVFGDNVKRVGLGGQAAAMRHEPNAVGVATKYSPSEPFGEEPHQIAAQKRIIDEDMKPLFRHVRLGGIVVWPADGIGTGLAGLDRYAPSTLEHIQNKLAALIRVAKLFDRGATYARVTQEAAEHL